MSRVAPYILFLLLVVGALPPPVAAQSDASCSLAAYGGAALLAPEELPYPQRAIGVDIGSGFALGVGFRCPVAGRYRIGLELERERLNDFSIVRAMGTFGWDGLEKSVGDGSIMIRIDARLGWGGGSEVGTYPAVLRCPPEGSCAKRQLGGMGPVVGLDGRIERPLSERTRAFLRAAWRLTLLDIRGEPEDRTVGGLVALRSEPVHTFPLVLGLGVDL